MSRRSPYNAPESVDCWFPMVWPEMFKAGGVFWRLVVAHRRIMDLGNGADNNGYMNEYIKVLEISTDVDATDTFCHEFLHIVQYFLGKFDDEEVGSEKDAGYEDQYAQALRMFLVDNPKFWIDFILHLVACARDRDRMVDLLRHAVKRVREIGLTMGEPTGLFMEG